ncbi:SRPBCC family protein [Actinomycetospora sp. OC33-EN08]|uniref:SRPBCC family protein n=1 Tax=Actinomycetospora aurantiaca TaxID=3129233 RepID=A0ABU8MLD4_9PSEU
MNVTERVVVSADPDAVWKVAGDAANVADWVPALESSSLDGDLRRAVLAGGGGEAFERITERDDSARTYVYEYESGPLALEFYRSRLSVEPHQQGSEVVWGAEFRAASDEEAGLAEAISGIYRSGLEELASRWPA